MRRAEAAPGLSMEVLVEQDELFPVRVRREPLVVAMTGAAAVLVREEGRGEPPRELERNLAEVHPASRAAGHLDRQLVPVIVVIALERLDEEIVHRKPHRAAPVRVAAEGSRRRLSRIVGYAVLPALHDERVRPHAIDARERADAVRRQELALVEHVGEGSLEPAARGNREETVAVSAAALPLHVGDVAG